MNAVPKLERRDIIRALHVLVDGVPKLERRDLIGALHVFVDGGHTLLCNGEAGV